jgi:hypothetical protein
VNSAIRNRKLRVTPSVVGLIGAFSGTWLLRDMHLSLNIGTPVQIAVSLECQLRTYMLVDALFNGTQIVSHFLLLICGRVQTVKPLRSSREF